MSTPVRKPERNLWDVPATVGGIGSECLCSHILLRIPYSHTDMMGIVNHGRYFEYFEAVREHYVRRRGVSALEFMGKGRGLPLVGAHFQFEKPAYYGDEVVAEARIVHFTRVRLRFQYRIAKARSGDDATEALLARGWTDHAFTVENMTLKPFPDALRRGLLSAERES